MLPKKLTSGDQFKAITVRRINEIIDFITKHRIVAGSGVSLNRYPSGTVVSVQGAGSGGSSGSDYDGYLKAVYDAEKKAFNLVCGFNLEEEIAGFCWVNGQKHIVSKETSVQAKEGFLCLAGKLGEEKVLLEILEQIPGKAIGDSDTDYHPIALITKQSSGGSTEDSTTDAKESYSCFQLSRYEFPQLWILGECEDEPEKE